MPPRTSATPAKAAKPATRPKPSKDRPSRRTPSKDRPTKDRPSKDQPNKDLPTKDRPSKDRPFAGQRFAFFGDFAIWPAYHGASPASVAGKLGATLAPELDDAVDVVVFGDLRGRGRSEAKRKAEKLAAGPGARLQILDEAAYRDLVRVELAGKRFVFVGGFDCSPAGLEDGLLARMVEAAGGVVVTEVDDALDYLVIGNRRGPSKIAASNKAGRLNDAGAHIVKLDESAFLELVRVDRPAAAGDELDFAGFVNLLYGHVDERKLGRALDMLRKERFQLYTHLDDQRLVGVVRSQTGSGNVYASWLTAEGRYGCSQDSLEACMGLQGSTCKHLLVLLVGLARTGQMPPPQALAWVRAAQRKSPQDDRDLCAETFIQYKGAEAGELDWRPTETIPEDFYAR